MSYKVGDRVRIRKDLKQEESYYMSDQLYWDIATRHMIEHAGKIAIVERVLPSGNGYKINLDAKEYIWTDEMFEEKKLKKFNGLEE